METKNYLRRMVEMGEEKLGQVLRPRPGGVFLSVTQARRGKASTGNYRRNISGRVTRDRGIVTDGGRVVYGPWLEGEGSRNKTTRFKGYRSFRNTATWLNERARGVGLRAVSVMARRLNG